MILFAEKATMAPMEDPEAPVEKDRCPECNKKALSARVRTNDFRCSGCNTVFERPLIDRHLRLAYESRMEKLFARFVARVIKAPPVKEEVPKVETAEAGSAFTFLAVFLFGAGIFVPIWWRETLGLGLLPAIGVGVVAGIVFVVLLALGFGAIASKEAEASHKEKLAAAEAVFQKRLQGHERWKEEHSELLRLHETFIKEREAIRESDDEHDGSAPRAQEKVTKSYASYPERVRELEADRLVSDMFPDAAVRLKLRVLHPEEIKAIVAAVSEGKLTTRPEIGMSAYGTSQPFEELSKEEKTEALRDHGATLAKWAAAATRPLSYSEMTPELRQMFAAALSSEGSKDERALFERLRNEIEQRTPPEAPGSPYRGTQEEA